MRGFFFTFTSLALACALFALQACGAGGNRAAKGGSGADEPVLAGAKQLKVMSFNMRETSYDVGTEHDWQLRRPACCALLKRHCPTIFGVQEPNPDQVRDIADETGYGWVGRPVSDADTPLGSHFVNAIFYDKARISLVDWGMFWYSDTPDEPSIGEGAFTYRAATWGIFIHRKTGRKFFMIDTHLDVPPHDGPAVRRRELTQLIETESALNQEGLPVIVTGDFNQNTGMEDDIFHILFDASFRSARDEAPATDTDYTFNDWGSSVTMDRIDHIFYRGGLKPLVFGVDRNGYLGVDYPSDHYPVYALFDFE